VFLLDKAHHRLLREMSMTSPTQWLEHSPSYVENLQDQAVFGEAHLIDDQTLRPVDLCEVESTPPCHLLQVNRGCRISRLLLLRDTVELQGNNLST
jgi:hypothetical protein